MPAPYSDDLRQKAIAAVKRGEKKIAVCRMLNISRSSLHSWLEREEQTGDCGPITHYQKGNRHKITDWDLFREFVQKHGDKWLEQSLVPQLQPGDVIVIDNASFHHSQTIEEIVAEAGCELWYLPPYSPDLNKIERWWFVLKNWMRQRWDDFDCFRDCVDAAFKQCPNVSP